MKLFLLIKTVKKMKTNYKSIQGMYFESALACALDNCKTRKEFASLWFFMVENDLENDLEEWRIKKHFSNAYGYDIYKITPVLDTLTEINILK